MWELKVYFYGIILNFFFFFITIILKFCLCLMNSYLKIKRENFWKYVSESLYLSKKFENIRTKMEKIRKKNEET